MQAARTKGKNMIRVYSFILSSFLAACTHASGVSASAAVCNIQAPNNINFTDLMVSVFTDRHGSYLSIDICPSHTVSVDFSHSDLYEARHANLLKQMRVSAYRGGNPIKMRISGTYRGSDGKDGPATVIVDKILEYKLSQ
jgi:hypothetical protein